MTDTLLQTYRQKDIWKDGDQLTKESVMEKQLVHDNGLLHLSVHLLVIDKNNHVLSRKRKADEFRYAGLWTSSIGTHVVVQKDYLSTLSDLLPLQ